MHNLIQIDLVAATAKARQRPQAPRLPQAQHPPPGRVRAVAARGLAAVALRVDAESARRAVA